MRLEGALFSSREGLISNGTAIATVGDNVSNSNTTGYKSVRPEFGDLFSALGKFDEGNVGNGSEVTKTRNIFTNGEVEQTGRALDVAIEGDGFFVLGGSTTATQATPLSYTRAGNLKMSDAGLLVSSDGKPILGYAGTATTGTPGVINLLDVAGKSTPTSTVSVTGNLDARSLAKTPLTTAATFNELADGSTTSQTVDVYDSLGARHTISLYFTKTETARSWKVDAYVDAAETGGVAGTPTKIGESTLVFDENGALTSGGTFTASTTFTGAAASSIAFDFSNFTQFAANSNQTGRVINGQPAGQVKGYQIEKSGAVLATLDNGTTIQLGTIALATFPNTDSLQRAGSNQFVVTDSTGTVTYGTPNSGPFGVTSGGALERSTVDLASQFTDLVVYQRGYQANSQMLNTTSQILKDTLGLIR